MRKYTSDDYMVRKLSANDGNNAFSQAQRAILEISPALLDGPQFTLACDRWASGDISAALQIMHDLHARAIKYG